MKIQHDIVFIADVKSLKPMQKLASLTTVHLLLPLTNQLNAALTGTLCQIVLTVQPYVN